LETFLQSYGYLAIMLGTFLEGETVLILGGLAAQRGYLDLTGVILAAFVGSLCGDQLFFYLGRRHSDFLMRRPSWQANLARANRLIDRFQTPLILGFRFLYGLRTVTPFALGISRVPAWRFVLLNVLGAGIWAAAISTGGFLFGNVLEKILGNLRHYERMLFALVAVVGGMVWAHFLYRRHRNRATAHSNPGHKEKP
jgi:membrane protein DedA with SNARE-associated domain